MATVAVWHSRWCGGRDCEPRDARCVGFRFDGDTDPERNPDLIWFVEVREQVFEKVRG